MPVIRSVSSSGFVVDPPEGFGIGDPVSVALLGGELIKARVVAAEGRGARCEFLEPLDPSRLHAVRAGGRVIRPGAAGLDMFADGIDDVRRWPLPLRAGISIGGAAALWALIIAALH
jgi:hypothetical protein